ncbi:carbamoyl-phosphate synthase large subunit [Acetobacteraceae bacterium]|nr:carbamoyl-phosphate synthase large subunit [Acetobacteraceae bacterium]
MPKRTDIKSILLIGAGPIVIGQGCEFDYSGAQACKALKEDGYRVILVNSNPATIMTDPDLADQTYIEPITAEFLTRIIEKEKPDALLPTMGGQTALNAALELDRKGILEKFGVELIGARGDVIDKAENRQRFREIMDEAGLLSPKSFTAHSLDEAQEKLAEIGLPVIIRPSFTLGGAGGGIAYNKAEFDEIVISGLSASPTTEVLVEESVIGWKEYEMEVVRDIKDNCIIICSIENIDPMGVHTGDSITVAPALTLTDKEFQKMRDASLTVLRKIGIETGGSNVQFAINPKDGRMVVIEMNPRVSRSSALASKATGFPIAKIAAKLAVGYTLDELDNDITGTTPASFEPVIDYIVTKIPRFVFEKFPATPALLSTSMKSVGEIMSIGRNFAESLQKGLRSLETGLEGLDDLPAPKEGTVEDYLEALATPRPDRLLLIAQAFRAGIPFDKIKLSSQYDPWFLNQIKQLVAQEAQIKENGLPKTAHDWREIKALGFSDKRLGTLCGLSEEEVRKARYAAKVHPFYQTVDTCANEFDAKTSYFYSSYEGCGASEGYTPLTPKAEKLDKNRKKVIILGGGPNRIGQGIEFDYCCVHAAYALREHGYETIMVNCNPETVSTDYDTSDRLYFEPLTAEDVLEILRVEQKSGTLLGCLIQYGGQTPLKLSRALEEAGIPILGTSADAIDRAEDRERFSALLRKLDLKQPKNAIALNAKEVLEKAEEVGYPLVVRPSYVLGGRAMAIVHDRSGLEHYLKEILARAGKEVSSGPVLLDHYLNDAIEVDVDCISDGEHAHVAGVMEHIEEAGIHSGDSACSLPPYSLAPAVVTRLRSQTEDLAKELNVKGLMNVQYAIKDDDIYVLEVNPRASRTIPFVAKATNVPVAKIGALVMAGAKLSEFNLIPGAALPHVSVKAPVFPFKRFAGVDTILGPEMRSTGEVMGRDVNFENAFAKAQLAANMRLPLSGNVLFSLRDEDKKELPFLAKKLIEMGFKVSATPGCAAYLQERDIPVQRMNKLFELRPHCIDSIRSGEIQMVINTVSGRQASKDSFHIRQAALIMDVPNYTTLSGGKAAIYAIEALKKNNINTTPLQERTGGN